MSMIFYYAPMSTASISELVIEELGIPCDKKKLDIKAGDTKKPEYLKINPNGKVPTIVHDGVAIWESVAITMYLGEMFGVEKKLWPAQGPKRGEAMKWVAWTNVSLGEAVYRRGHNSGEWGDPADRDEKKLAKANADIQKELGILNAALEGKSYLLGNDYSLADAHVFSICGWLQAMKIDFSAHSHVMAWSGLCAKRPAFQKIMAAGG